MKRLAVSLGLALAFGVAGNAEAQHQHEAATPPQRLGTVHFATSCAKDVTADFDRGVALLHSFWFSAAIESFDKVLAKDPSCAIAYWGIAMSWWGNPFAGFRSPGALARGQAAVEKGRAAAAKTPRERDYIAAVAELYKDFGTVDQRTRTLAYEKAMEKLAATHTDDSEARLFYALALDQTALPTDRTYANLLKAGAILERELPGQPDHPGIAHYIIHSYDVPPLAAKALDAARRYAKIAPDAPHALHMPSHTFTRLGYWDESIQTNLASAAAARKDNAASEELHALDYQVYAYLQTAQDGAARKVVEAAPAIGARIVTNTADNAAPPPAGFYALAAIPARQALERNAWKDAAALTPHESAFPWTDAITYYARALGAARSGDPQAAEANIEKLAALAAALKSKNDAYWANQVEIQRRAATAWMMFAQGRKEDAVAEAREAAAMEDATEKSAVTPGPIKPARELLGEMLLEIGRPAEALSAFEETMTREPNRFRSIEGAARAAQASGNTAKARSYYAKLVELCPRGDRPDLEAARKLVGR
jgi:hypothetical protein